MDDRRQLELIPPSGEGLLRPGARASLEGLRTLADQAFSRAAGAPLIGGNSVRLLEDARENYPAWLEAISRARRHVHFECYIIHEDKSGARFTDALIERARAGVKVRLVYDWLGCFGTASADFWDRLEEAGVEVRVHNPPKFSAPLGWLSRDHRKMVAVDGEVAFVTGLCVGDMWAGDPERRRDPWRDTGVELRGPAVAEVERGFARVWATLGPPLSELPEVSPAAKGGVNVRVVATEPSTAGMMRLDQLVTALARERIWLTDAYYVGTSTYVQALCTAAREGVDVRLLVPGATDLPLVKPLTRAGYRVLLEAGVRIFEWNGTMLHAKTAVADGRWARVGSTNLNLASWLGNYELDLVIEDGPFAEQMEEMYERDLAHSTEIVLERRRRTKVAPTAPVSHRRGGRGSGRAAAGALRIGHAIGAAVINSRVLEPNDARVMALSGLGFLGLAVLFGFFPWALMIPAVGILAWFGLSFLWRAITLRRDRDPPP